MLSPPDGLSENTLAAVLAHGWGVAVMSLVYRPVGFGSHHWQLTDGDGAGWFVTVDDLAAKRHYRHEPLDRVFARLRASLTTAGALRDHGRTFVVAPVPCRDGGPLVRLGDRFGVALYPFVEGQSFTWGGFPTPEHRDAVLDLIIDVHAAPAEVLGHARADDFTVPHRDDLTAGLDPAGDAADCGPYARHTADLLAAHAAPVRRLLARYDDLVDQGRAQASRTVLTHGEPHPGNTMLTATGWLLIDWDTALVAPPERDLWGLDPGDGSVLATYAAATGVTPLPALLDLYRIRWDLADMAIGVSGFRSPHTASPDYGKSWEILRSLISGLDA